MSAETWQQLVEDFLADRATLTRRGLSPNSQRAYHGDLTDWARHLNPDTDGEHLNWLTIAHLDQLTVRGVKNAYRRLRLGRSPATCARRIGTLKLFCGWLIEEELLAHDPTAGIQAPAREDHIPIGWTTEELARIGEAVTTSLDTGRPDSRRWPERDQAIFAVLACAGLRAAELLTLRHDDLEADDDITLLHVRGKGGKLRVVPLPPEATAALNAYLAHKADRELTGELVFTATNGQPMTPGALDHLIRRWLRKAGVPIHPGACAHAFRHSYAKGLVEAGVPVPQVAELLGHADIKTTGIYLRATATQVRAAALASPARTAMPKLD